MAARLPGWARVLALPVLIGLAAAAANGWAKRPLDPEIAVELRDANGNDPGGERPLVAAVSPEGDIAYVTNAISDNVSVIDVATNSVTSTLAAGNQPVGVAFMPLPLP